MDRERFLPWTRTELGTGDLDRVKGRGWAGEQALAIRGQLIVPVVADEQRAPKIPLQRPDLMADGGGRQM
jgi:hypothetical protein